MRFNVTFNEKSAFNPTFKDVTVVNQIEATASVEQEPGDAAVETTVTPTESGMLVHFAFSGH